MVTDSEQENPFAVPGVRDDEVVLTSSDGQFVLDGNKLLCRSQVVLPQICIHLGDTQDLHLRTAALSSTTFSGVVTLLATVSCIVAGVATMAAGILVAAAAAGILLMALLANNFMKHPLFPVMIRVNVSWYVSDRYVRSRRRKMRIRRGLAVLFATLCGVVIGGANGRSLMAVGAAGSVAAVASLLLSLFLSAETPLRISGKRHHGPFKGMNLLSGFSRHFTETVRAHSDRWQ